MKSIKETTISENGKFIYNLIDEVVSKTGPRLPTSKEEEMGCDIICDQINRELEITPIKESFKAAPKASVGAIPLLGYSCAVMFATFYLSPIASLVIGCLLLSFSFIQIFTYSGILDFLFKKGKSHNIYSILNPEKEADYTILLSAHIDSSWCWKLSYKNPKTAIPKTAYGAFSILLMLVLSIWAISRNAINLDYLESVFIEKGPLTNKQIQDIVMYTLPFLSLPGAYWLANYLSWDPKIASPGAMDNMSGIAIGIAAAKYLKENPDKCPKNCRIIISAMGCEEAGLKGSNAFVKAHKNDPWFNDRLYNINLDSFRDDNNFNVVKGDVWLGTHFDKDLVKMSCKAMTDAGLKPHIISNPAGGCDSTPFCKSKIKTVTLNAQVPTITNYYHTPNDTVQGLSIYSLEKGFETVLNLISEIDNFVNK